MMTLSWTGCLHLTTSSIDMQAPCASAVLTVEEVCRYGEEETALTGSGRRAGRLKALEPVGHLLQDGLQLQHIAGLCEAAWRNHLHCRHVPSECTAPMCNWVALQAQVQADMKPVKPL